LKELGFEIDRQVIVKCEGGKITITLADEIMVEG